MDINLSRHGFNVDRRKMYPSNPRNNLVSTVDFLWHDSLIDENNFPTARIRNKKSQEKVSLKEHYDDLINKQIDEDRRADKSSFRVLPPHPKDPKYFQSSQGLEAEQLIGSRNASISQRGQSGLNTISYENEPRKFNTSREILSPTQGLKQSSNLSRSVFGYEINPEKFKRQSYLTKVLSDRLSPYLEQSVSRDKAHKRHSSVMTNQIVELNY